MSKIREVRVDEVKDARPMSESGLLTHILFRHEYDPRCRLWRVNVIAANSGGKWFTSVHKGHPDIAGLIKGSGRAFYIECKVGRGELTSQQVSWRRMLEGDGALYLLARERDDVENLLQKETGKDRYGEGLRGRGEIRDNEQARADGRVVGQPGAAAEGHGLGPRATGVASRGRPDPNDF